MSKFTKRGVALPNLKEPAASRPIVNITELPQVIVPLVAADGSSCRPAVGRYETLLRGDTLGLPEKGKGYLISSPVTGILSDLRKMTHPLLGDVTCAVIDCMVTGGEQYSKKSTSKMSPADIIGAARQAGIVDELDCLPLALKLEKWKKEKAVYLVADGSEQEPYSSSAWAVINELGEQVSEGLELAARAVGAEEAQIAVRLPFMRRHELLKRLEGKPILSVRGNYPASIPPKSGETLCVLGVQACLALYHAASQGEKQNTCVVTVAGDAVANPQNVRVPIGTTVENVLHFCGLSENPQYVVLGDAMTGTTITQTDISILPGINCILALASRPQPPTRTCIGCGRCVHACHADLLPFEIVRRLDNMQYERLPSLLPDACDGCGACSYVCPSGLDVAAKVLEARETKGTVYLKWGDGDDL